MSEVKVKESKEVAVKEVKAKELKNEEVKKKPVVKKKVKTGINIKAKKKVAIARAVVKKGTGIIKINNRNIDIYEPKYAKNLILEPISIAGDLAKQYDIRVSVKGSGQMSQAIAARAAIAKSLVNASKNETLKNAYLSYDRMLLVDDVRRVESKKPLGKKARKKKQSSKR